jgi:2-keto-4-pentenoate hydratase/2-oxohepta-3-ene-1,7-dioic acid hydratase in catechol pathway
MRFVSFSLGGFRLYGRVEGDTVRLPSARFAATHPNLKAVIASEALARFEADAEAAPLPLSGLRFDPVIPDAGKILCAGRNYREHGDEDGRPENPPVFIRFADTQIGHKAPLVIPAATREFELEGELGLVIGRAGRAIAVAEALSHVAGYFCFNDASARDWQHHSPQYTAGKNFPGTGASGPFLVTSDEVGDPDALWLESRVDGIAHQGASTADMLFSTAELIAYVSRFTPLSPGDVIITGTPTRTEAGKAPNGNLRPGSVVEIEIENVGCLRNTVVREGENA